MRPWPGTCQLRPDVYRDGAPVDCNEALAPSSFLNPWLNSALRARLYRDLLLLERQSLCERLANPLTAPFVIAYLITNTDWSKVWKVVEGFWNDNWHIIQPLLITLGLLNPITAPFVIGYLITNTDWSKVWENAKKLAGLMRDGIQAAINGVKWVVEVVLIELVPKIISKAVDAFVAGAGDVAETIGVPTRDTGGIVSSPQLAALAMNSRPEAIIPLDRLPEMMDGRGGLTVNVHVTGDVNGVEKLREIIRQGILDGDRRGLEHAF